MKKIYSERLQKVCCFVSMMMLLLGMQYYAAAQKQVTLTKGTNIHVAEAYSHVGDVTARHSINASDGRQVSFAVCGKMPVGSSVNATPVTRNAQKGKQVYGAYDISITKDGHEWQPQPGKPAMVTISDPNYTDGRLMDVWHEGANGREFVATVMPTDGKITFPAYSFSVYIVTETGDYARLKVNFHQAGGGVVSVYVKRADIGAHFNDIVYNPGVGNLNSGEYFRGWTTNASYDVADIPNGMTFETVRDSIKARLNAGVHDGDVMDVYAMLFKSYSVSYLNENNAVAGADEVVFRFDDTNPQKSYTVNNAYTPGDNFHNFEGWKVNSGGNNIQGHNSDNKNYPNDTTIIISGDVVFSVNLSEGHWLIYHENGRGATYKSADFVNAGDVTHEPTLPMTRNGYQFAGWYEGAPATEGGDPTSPDPFVFGQQLNYNTDVYAKWTPNRRADYTVIIWKRNVDDDGYDYDTAITLRGMVNQPIGTVSVQGSDDGRYAIINGVDFKDTVNGHVYTGFHLDSLDQGVTINTEGNAVLNVYYGRNKHTLTFQVRVASQASGTGGTQYGLVDGEYVELTYHPATWTQWYSYWSYIATNCYYYTGTHYYLDGNQYRRINANQWSNYDPNYGRVDGNYVELIKYGDDWVYCVDEEETYTGTRYTLAWVTVKTITALYGQPIGDNFPIVGTNGTTYTGYSWDPQSSTPYSEILVYIDVMPDADVTFHASGSGNSFVMNYYVEALPDETVDTTYGGVGYHLYRQISAGYNFATEAEDYFDISGYTKNGTDPAFEPHPNHPETMIIANSPANFFYLLSKYTINFMDGAYYDGDNNRLSEIVSQGQLQTVSNISYRADVSSYNNFTPSTTPNGFVFDGWYMDATCTQPYTFDKMPEGGVTVYAKWRQIQYRVFLHPNADGITDLNWGSTSQKMNFRITYGNHISAPTGTSNNYEFVGWFTDAACTRAFNETAVVLNETTVTTPYNKTTDFTDPMNKWGQLEGPQSGWFCSDTLVNGNGTNRPWVTKKYELYGKWRARLSGANGIVVIYNANGGDPTTVPEEPYLYQDNVDAVAGDACEYINDTKEFSHWVMQRYNTSTGAYEDIPGSAIFPGASFTVLKSNAKMRVIAWYRIDANNDTIYYNTPFDSTSLTPPHSSFTLYKATYTVQLRAAYVDAEEQAPTFIVWYMNDGSGQKVRQDGKMGTVLGDAPYQQLQVNQAVPVPAAPTRAGYIFKGWYKANIDSSLAAQTSYATGCTPNFLYYNNSIYYSNSTYTNRADSVFADETNPYDYLYAVWVPDVDLDDFPRIFCLKQTDDITLPTVASSQNNVALTWTYNGSTVTDVNTSTTVTEAIYTYTTADGCVTDTIHVTVRDGATLSITNPGVVCSTVTGGTVSVSATITDAPADYMLAWLYRGSTTDPQTYSASNTTATYNANVVPDGGACVGTYPLILGYNDGVCVKYDTIDIVVGVSDSWKSQVADSTKIVTCVSGVVTPTPPDITDNCGNAITFTATTIPSAADIAAAACGGEVSYVYEAKDCTDSASHKKEWRYTYTISVADFTIADADGASTVNCIADATMPSAPAVTDHCGNALTPSDTTIVDTPDPVSCEGTRVYTFTYTDCKGNHQDWTYTYTIEYEDFSITEAAGASTVNCIAEATMPTAPAVTDHCGNSLTPSDTTVADTPDPVTCEGTRVYTFTYTDCEGNHQDWTYTYTDRNSDVRVKSVDLGGDDVDGTRGHRPLRQLTDTERHDGRGHPGSRDL